MRIDLFKKIPALKWLCQRRWFQFAVILPNLFLFLFFLTAGTFGSPVGNRNIIIIFVWILWWFLLISLMVPFFSRIWCTVCPFPFFGEWLQRRALIRARGIDPKKKEGPGITVGRNRYFGLNLRWPKVLSNIWIQNIGFLALCTFSALFLTRPIVSVFVLGSLFLIATVMHQIYRQRAFCNYVCPVSGFLSLYSMTSMVEVRSKDYDVCVRCKDKGCLAGNDKGWGCPWMLYPSKLDRNNYCGLCMECFKTCPYDNMTINLRPFASDTKLKGYDEAWKAFIMLTLAIAYSLIYLGPWSFFKDWANITEKWDLAGFIAYGIMLWISALLLMPGIYYLAVYTGRKLSGSNTPSFKEMFLNFAYPLVPLGLLAWIAFSFPLILVNGSYILMVLSDPFGWGWNLFGTANIKWTPVIPHWTPYIQVSLLLIGLYYSLKKGYIHALQLYSSRSEAIRGFAPVAILLTGIVLFFLRLYAG
ncbi:MAG: 4Fe-4S binding protein [Acidobacteriota bacterium]